MTPSQKDHKRKTRLSIESFLPVQFGGTLTDYVSASKTLPSGDIVIIGRTFSSTFMGVSTAPYIAGGSNWCIYVLLLDKFLAKKALVFEYGYSGGADIYPGVIWNNATHCLDVDESGNVYYVLAPYDAAAVTVVKRSGVDLSLTTTNNTVSVRYCACSISYHDGYLYMAYINTSGKVCAAKYPSSLASVTTYNLYSLDATSCGTDYTEPIIAATANGVYVLALEAYFVYFSKWSTSFSFLARRDFYASGKPDSTYYYQRDLIAYDNKLYFCYQPSVPSGHTSDYIKISAVSQSDLADVSGYTDAVIAGESVLVAPYGNWAVIAPTPEGYISVFGNIQYVDPDPNKYRKVRMKYINRNTGADVVAEQYMKYADGSDIVSQRYGYIYAGAATISGNRIFVAGYIYTPSAIQGYTNLGGYDVFALKLNSVGKAT